MSSDRGPVVQAQKIVYDWEDGEDPADGPMTPRRYARVNQLEVLQQALREGDTQRLREAIVEVSGLPLAEVRRRRLGILDPLDRTSGAPQTNKFETPLARLLVRADVYLERWEVHEHREYLFSCLALFVDV
jgi:hypothetical protein